MLLNVAGRKNEIGVLAVGVPGSLKGWTETLRSYGASSLEDVLQPALRYAERGFRATRYLSDIIRKCADDIAMFPETAKTWRAESSRATPPVVCARF